MGETRSGDHRRASGNRKKESRAGDDCRCREMSEKSIPELFRVMIRDLSFRKKRAGKPRLPKQ